MPRNYALQVKGQGLGPPSFHPYVGRAHSARLPKSSPAQAPEGLKRSPNVRGKLGQKVPLYAWRAPAKPGSQPAGLEAYGVDIVYGDGRERPARRAARAAAQGACAALGYGWAGRCPAGLGRASMGLLAGT